MLRNTPVPFCIGFEWMIGHVVFEGHKLPYYIMCCTLTQLEYNIEYKWKRCYIQQPHNNKTKPVTTWNTQLCLNLELFPLWHLKTTITKSQNKVLAKFLLTSLLFKCSSITTPSYSSYNDADDNCVKTTKPTTHYIHSTHNSDWMRRRVTCMNFWKSSVLMPAAAIQLSSISSKFWLISARSTAV